MHPVFVRCMCFSGAIAAIRGSQFGQGYGRFLMDGVTCTGEEASLNDCQHLGWGNEDCGSSENAGVACRGQLVSSVVQVKEETDC